MATFSSSNSVCTNSGRIILEPIEFPISTELPDKINKLLESVKSLDLESGSSEISEISDPMREFYKDSIYYDRAAIKHLSRPEIHKKIMDGFTDEFRKTSKKLREKMDIGYWLLAEDDIAKNEESVKAMSEKKKKALRDVEHINEDYPEPSETGASSLTYDYMSGIWRMVRERCKENEEFFVTPIGYNVYRDTENYWLEYPEVNGEVLEEAKEKCSRWVNRYL